MMKKTALLMAVSLVISIIFSFIPLPEGTVFGKNNPPGSDTGSGQVVVYGFDDIDNNGKGLNGVHGGIDFGNGDWKLEDFYGGLTRCAYYHKKHADSASIILPPGKVLISVKLTTGTAGETYKISDGVNEDITGTFNSADTPVTVNTGWVLEGRTVTFTFSENDNTFIDDITYADAEADLGIDVTYYNVTPDNVIHSITEYDSGGNQVIQTYGGARVRVAAFFTIPPIRGIVNISVGALTGTIMDSCMLRNEDLSPVSGVTQLKGNNTPPAGQESIPGGNYYVVIDVDGAEDMQQIKLSFIKIKLDIGTQYDITNPGSNPVVIKEIDIPFME